MIDYSHLFGTRDVRQIEQTIQQMDNSSLMQLHDKAERNIAMNSWLARWPVLGHVAADLGVSAGLVALSQPLAKWRGWTTKSFGQYMKHPAALAAMALSGVVGIFTQKMDLEDANSVDIVRLTEREITMRASEDTIRGIVHTYQQPGGIPGLAPETATLAEHIQTATADASTASVPTTALEIASTTAPALEAAMAPAAPAQETPSTLTPEVAVSAETTASPAVQALANLAGHPLTMAPVSQTGATAPAVTVTPTAEPASVIAPPELTAAMQAPVMAPAETAPAITETAPALASPIAEAAASHHHAATEHHHQQHPHKPHAHTMHHEHHGHAAAPAHAAALAG